MQANYNHFDYGERLARSLKPISHSDVQRQFFRATEIEELRELSARISDASGMILVAIDGNNSDFDSKISDNLVERPQYFFLILASTESGNVDTIFAAQRKCKEAATQVVARMALDHQAYRNGLAFLEDESFTIRGVGPIADNFYGVIVGFNLLFGVDCRIDTSIWNDGVF